jgi:hypothetical protein
MMKNTIVLKWCLALISILFVLGAKSSSISVSLGVPYHQISGDVRAESCSHSPFARTWEGATKVYFQDRFLYRIDKYFSGYTAVSKDGENFYELYFHFKDDVAIHHYQNGMKINEIKTSYIKDLLKYQGQEQGHYFWSLYHQEYKYNRSKFSMLDFFGKFRNSKIKKIDQANEFIFIKKDVLYVKALKNKLISLDLASGKVDVQEDHYLPSSDVKEKSEHPYRKILRYNLLGNGKFPRPKNGNESFASLVKKTLLSNEIFRLSKYKGRLELYFNITLKNDGFIDAIALSIKGKAFKSTPEQDSFLTEVLRKTKFSTRNIPKGCEFLTFTSWGGVQSHPVLIDF